MHTKMNSPVCYSLRKRPFLIRIEFFPFQVDLATVNPTQKEFLLSYMSDNKDLFRGLYALQVSLHLQIIQNIFHLAWVNRAKKKKWKKIGICLHKN